MTDPLGKSKMETLCFAGLSVIQKLLICVLTLFVTGCLGIWLVDHHVANSIVVYVVGTIVVFVPAALKGDMSCRDLRIVFVAVAVLAFIIVCIVDPAAVFADKAWYDTAVAIGRFIHDNGLMVAALIMTIGAILLAIGRRRMVHAQTSQDDKTN